MWLTKLRQERTHTKLIFRKLRTSTKRLSLSQKTPSSREQEFFEQLEQDFHLEVADSRRGEPPPTSEDLGTESTSCRIAAERDVYLLLGTRRENRDEKGRHSPLEKWRRQIR